MKNVLFVTWDGPQTSYLESLFLPIFSELKMLGYQFHVLQFTWADDKKIKQQQQACQDLGISYRNVNVWRKPSVAIGSLATSFKGVKYVKKAIKELGIDIVMPRSTQPALATLLALKSFPDVKMIFDADGLPLDERVDFANQSPSSFVQRFLRDVERQAVIKSKHVITRAQAASNILHARAGAGSLITNFSVVTNGRDENLFRMFGEHENTTLRDELGIKVNEPMLVYAGSLGEQYCIDEMLVLFTNIKNKYKTAKLVVLTGSPEKLSVKLNLYPDLKVNVICKTVLPNDVPKYLSAADLGLALRRPSFSMQAVAPIKLSEYLLCGLPTIATEGIGDTGIITSKNGFLVSNMDDKDLSNACNWFIEKYENNAFERELIRQESMKTFSVKASSLKYAEALSKV